MTAQTTSNLNIQGGGLCCGGEQTTASSCEPVVGTRQSILANLTAVKAGCVYTANNITHVSAGGTGTFTVIATEDGRLPDEGVYYSNSLTGNHPWPARMDWQTGRIYYIHDTVNNNEITGYQVIANFPFGNTNVQNNRITNADSFNYTDGIFRQNNVGESSKVTLTAGSIQRSTITADSIVTQNGTGSIIDCVINDSVIVNQDVTFADNQVTARSSINTSGSSGIIQYSTFNFGNAVALQNISSLTIYYSTLSASRYLLTGAQTINIRYTEVTAYAYIQATGAAQLLSYYNTVSNLGYIRVLNGGNLNVQRSKFDSNGYLDHNCGANTTVNRVYRCSASSVGGLRFLNSATNCRFYQCHADSNSYQRFEGTSNGSYAYNNRTSSSGYMRWESCINGRYYYNTAHSNGFIRAIGSPSTNYIYYCSMTSQSRLQTQSLTGRVYATHGSGRAQFNLTNHAGNLYYSSAAAYYYLQGGKTSGTLTGFHGYGRQTYTMPATGNQTGSPTRNI